MSRTLETGSEDLLGHVKDRVAVLTMNRPQRRNALSGSMLRALARTLAEVETDPEVGCVVLTGAERAFCAGGDVKGMAKRNESSGPRKSLDEVIHEQRLMQRATAGRLYEMPKPTIAALPGAAAGAGLSLALACDLRVASDNAVLTTAFAKVGFAGDYGGTFFLTRLIGAAKARELYFLSEKLDSSQAKQLGLVSHVWPESHFEEKTLELAHQLAHGPGVAYRYMKENLNRAVRGEMGECLDMEATHHVHTSLTEDHRNAVKAFVEKREPLFRGR